MSNGKPDFLMALPLPPSQNSALKVGIVDGRARMYHARCVEEWQAKCYEKLLQFDGAGRIKNENVFMFVTFYKSGNGKYDIDNLAKKLQDILTGVVYTDDKFIIHCSSAKKPCLKGEDRCVVAVYRRSTNAPLYELLSSLHDKCLTEEGNGSNGQ